MQPSFEIGQEVWFPAPGRKLRMTGFVAKQPKNDKIAIRYGNQNKIKEFPLDQVAPIETELSWDEEHSNELVLEDGTKVLWNYKPPTDEEDCYLALTGDISPSQYDKQPLRSQFKKCSLVTIVRNYANSCRAAYRTIQKGEINNETVKPEEDRQWQPGDRLIVGDSRGTFYHDTHGKPWVRYTTGVNQPLGQVTEKVGLDSIQWHAGDQFERGGETKQIWTIEEKGDFGIQAKDEDGHTWPISWWHMAVITPLAKSEAVTEENQLETVEAETPQPEPEQIVSAEVSVVEAPPQLDDQSVGVGTSNPYDPEERLRQLADDIKVRMKRTAIDVYHIGANLLEAKELLPHGKFLPWLKAEFEMSQRAAYNFMNVATAFGDKFANFANLDIATAALYQLADPGKTSLEAVDEATERAKSGETVTPEVAKEILQKHPPAKPPRKTRESTNTALKGKGRSLGLPGTESQQLPDTQQNDAPVPPPPQAPSPWSLPSSFTFELADGTPIVGKYFPGTNGNPAILTLTGEITRNPNGSISKIVSAADRGGCDAPIEAAKLLADLARRSYLAELDGYLEPQPQPETPNSKPVENEKEQQYFTDWHTAWVSNLEEMPDELLVTALKEVSRRALKGRSIEGLKGIYLAAKGIEHAVNQRFNELFSQVVKVEEEHQTPDNSNQDQELEQTDHEPEEDLRLAAEFDKESC